MSAKKVRPQVLPLPSESFDGCLYLPYDPGESGVRFPVITLLGSEEGEIRSIASELSRLPHWQEKPYAIVGLHPHDWAHDYSPLDAPPLRDGVEAFTAGAGEHLREITGKLFPELVKNAPLLSDPCQNILAGYSLAGLCALYGAYAVPEHFSGFAACSPSLWMEGWMDYMKATPLPQKTARLYLSLGKKEPITKNPRMARVGAAFEEASALLSAALPEGDFRAEWNNGNHFFEPDRRIARGLAFLTE